MTSPSPEQAGWAVLHTALDCVHKVFGPELVSAYAGDSLAANLLFTGVNMDCIIIKRPRPCRKRDSFRYMKTWAALTQSSWTGQP